MRVRVLSRVDTFPYRYRLRDVMTVPLATVRPDLPLAVAAERMSTERISSLIVTRDDSATPRYSTHETGIVTEGDVLWAITQDGTLALGRPISDYAQVPLQALPAGAMVYRALGRMDRLGLRHMGAVDDEGKLVGIITPRVLLKQRASEALALGDGITIAPDAKSLAEIRQALPHLTEDLLSEDVPPLDVVAVISEVMRDITARSAALAEAAMAAEGHGRPPARFCVLILGSAGRGESLLAPDQDSALIHDGSADDDAWFAEFASRMTATLDEAGIPYCKGGVMASQAAWRGNRETWEDRVAQWVRSATPEHLLNVDIFFDFQPVYGDGTLARSLRLSALSAAGKSIPFLKLMSQHLWNYRPPLGLLGRIRTREFRADPDTPRVDLKLGGLLPIVAGVRAIVLRHGIGTTSTTERLGHLRNGDLMREADADMLSGAHEVIVGTLLRQQIADIAAERAPGNWVGVRPLERRPRRDLRDALRRLEVVPQIVEAALTASA